METDGKVFVSYCLGSQSEFWGGIHVIVGLTGLESALHSRDRESPAITAGTLGIVTETEKKKNVERCNLTVLEESYHVMCKVIAYTTKYQ